MSFSVQLTPDLAPVEPGSTTPVSVVVVSRSDEQDRFEMEIEGVDPEWKAVPVPVFAVEPGETHTEKVFFKPRRTSESLAGNYPFVVRVRSLNSGDQRTIQGVLQIKPFHHLTMEISPKKGFISPTRKLNSFDVAIVNLGNTDHTLQLVGSDPEDAGAYEFEHEQVTIAPGQQREVELNVNPTSQPLFSGGRLIGFTVSGRSIDAPSIVTTSQAQLEQRSLFSPASLVVLTILALMLAAWLMMMPKPPTMSLSVDPPQVMLGEEVTVSWSATNASRITIKQGEEVLYDGPELTGTRKFKLDVAGTQTFYAVAKKDARVAQGTSQVTVEQPDAVPPPQILALAADPPRVKIGNTFILRYRLGDSVERAVLSPIGQELDKSLTELEITPTREGENEYTVVATNKSGITARKSIKITVYDESDAKVISFEANPASVEGPTGTTVLTWMVTGAVRVELRSGDGNVQLVDSSGTAEATVSQKTTYVITAYDTKGRRVTRNKVVQYVAPKPPPVEDPPGGTDGTTTGGTTDGTTATTTGTTVGGGIR